MIEEVATLDRLYDIQALGWEAYGEFLSVVAPWHLCLGLNLKDLTVFNRPVRKPGFNWEQAAAMLPIPPLRAAVEGEHSMFQWAFIK